MRLVFGLVLIIGLALAGFAVNLVRGQMQVQEQQIAQAQAAVQQATPTVEVLAVQRTIPFGDTIKPEDVITIRYAQPYLPVGTYATREDFFPQGETVLRAALRQIEASEPLLAVKVTEPGQPASLTGRLQAGMRAFTITIDATRSISGFLRPGDRVDVYWTGTAESGNAREEVTKLIDTAVEIIAIDQIVDTNSTEVNIGRTATVQVTPQQVANLAQAQATGSLSISLVGQDDIIPSDVDDVTQRSLLGLVEAERPVATPGPAAEPVCTIRTRRGSDVVDMQIPCTN